MGKKRTAEGEKERTEPRGPSRRRFLKTVWTGLGIVALGEFVAVGIAFFQPRKKTSKAGDFGSVIEAGDQDKFPRDSVTAFVRGKFYLARLEDGGFLALSSKCTHLGCTIPWISKEKKFVCPCHSSAFDMRGEVVNPPAPRTLDTYEVFFENKIVKVDTGKRIKRSVFRPEQVAYLK